MLGILYESFVPPLMILSWQIDFELEAQREGTDTLDASRSERLGRSFYTPRPLARDSLPSTP